MPTDPDDHDYIKKLLEQELADACGRSREELIAQYASDGLTQQAAEAHVDLLMKDLAERQARVRRMYADRGVRVNETGGT